MEITKLEKELLSEKENLENQLSAYKREDPYASFDREPSAAVEDSVTETEGHDRIMATRLELKQRLLEVSAALNKIESGKFGFCEKCGQKIRTERLEVLPTARFCLECKGNLRH
ncbi:MAG: hypothetical protein A2172_01980 [Candidatus Woykebacteria bacterium RBG_13_40_15]|uniref:Zinc finger DksA/TraR C4-type domain-containing protein n=1 Tax=Candidatus Woykebacteria bacterium RBG_13_40_15 TaxID=1802593 RepID=A0A1G1W643_9BACT|nr:MAG: hypothetical protein A2172_01980 [Candidatus Woykebacteria bacterium RBG_13_40_15]